LQRLNFRRATPIDNEPKTERPKMKTIDEFDRQFVDSIQAAKQHQEMVYADTLKKGTYGAKALVQAAKTASDGAENDGLHPELDVPNREWRYTVKQGLRAACVTREDAAATLMLQVVTLNNQQSIKRLLWMAIALLAYIAYKLS
jgi:hypothetical protein